MQNIMQEIHCKVVGKVQMVMFRDFVRRHARSLGLTGTVQNLPDGSVEVVAQGNEAELDALIEKLHKGPFLAHVIRVDVERRKPSGSFDGFTIVY